MSDISRWITGFKKTAQVILNFAMPARCLCCGCVVESHGNLCAECWNGMTFITGHKCKICGLGFEFDLGSNAVCGACMREKPDYTKAIAVAEYEGTARLLLIKLKFGDGVHLAPHLAKYMAGFGAELVRKADFIAPIPLHYRRKIWRRYNQAGLLGFNLARLTGVNYQPLLLKRNRHTTQQTKLLKKDRKANVHGAFDVRGDVKGKRVLLVDDVLTTGATLSACARALRECGAKRVYCLVFARVGVEV